MQSFTLLIDGAPHQINSAEQLCALTQHSSVIMLYANATTPWLPWHERGAHYLVDATNKRLWIDDRLHLLRWGNFIDERDERHAELVARMKIVYDRLVAALPTDVRMLVSLTSDGGEHNYNVYLYADQHRLSIELLVDRREVQVSHDYSYEIECYEHEILEAMVAELHCLLAQESVTKLRREQAAAEARYKTALIEIAALTGLHLADDELSAQLAQLRDHLLLAPDGPAAEALSSDFAQHRI